MNNTSTLRGKASKNKQQSIIIVDDVAPFVKLPAEFFDDPISVDAIFLFGLFRRRAYLNQDDSLSYVRLQQLTAATDRKTGKTKKWGFTRLANAIADLQATGCLEIIKPERSYPNENPAHIYVLRDPVPPKRERTHSQNRNGPIPKTGADPFPKRERTHSQNGSAILIVKKEKEEEEEEREREKAGRHGPTPEALPSPLPIKQKEEVEVFNSSSQIPSPESQTLSQSATPKKPNSSFETPFNSSEQLRRAAPADACGPRLITGNKKTEPPKTPFTALESAICRARGWTEDFVEMNFKRRMQVVNAAKELQAGYGERATPEIVQKYGDFKATSKKPNAYDWHPSWIASDFPALEKWCDGAKTASYSGRREHTGCLACAGTKIEAITEMQNGVSVWVDSKPCSVCQDDYAQKLRQAERQWGAEAYL